MNTSHYPSLELCKKLTKIGFPISQCLWMKTIMDYHEITIRMDEWVIRRGVYVCPSVMEMLDVMPDTIVHEYQLHLWKNSDTQYGVHYKEIDGHSIGECGKGFATLPNALALMILWLHENNYISFTK